MIRYAYIAGPVTGIPDRNRPAFEAARPVVAEILGLSRRFVCIPHDLFWSNWTGTEARAMEMCLSHICCRINDGHALTIVLLPGWRESLGCAVEVALARKLGVPVCELHGDELVVLSPGHQSEAARRATGETASDHANLGKETQT